MKMKLDDVAACPLSGEAGKVKFESVADAFFDTEGTWRYRQDQHTGHLWLDPRPAPDHIGELYRNYYTHNSVPSGGTSIWQQAMALALTRRLGYRPSGAAGFLARLVSVLPSVGDAAEMEMMRVPSTESGDLLDVGCGSGAFLQRMSNAGWHVMGTEPDPNAAARLRAKLGFQVFSNVEEVEAQHKQFDLITLSHVIEHVPDPLATMGQLAKLLAPGGRLIVTTPNAESLGALIFGKHWRGLEPPRHFNVFTPRSLAAAIEKSGMRVDLLRTEVRLARGIFYLSALARCGHSQLEILRRPQHRLLKIAGYLFQLCEAATVRIFRSSGEEICCSATLSKGSEGLVE